MFDVVINPASSSGQVNQIWKKQIEPILKQENIKYDVYYSTPSFGIVDILKQLTSKNIQKDIILIGGDGTMNLAINGIQDFKNTRIGFIPTGSGNDFAKGLHLSKNIKQCCESILQNKTMRTIDIGEVTYNTRYHEIHQEQQNRDGYVHRKFNISCGIGFDAAICQQVDVSKFKKILNRLHLGKLIYIFVAIKIIASTKRIPTSITIDGETTKYSELLFAVAMNTPYEGGGFAFCPHAKEDDQQLDVCIGNALSQFDFFKIFPYAYFGKHLKFHGVYEQKAKQIRVQSKKPMWVHTDGEVACQSDDICIHLCKEQLKMLD